jgi:hypothetical protein
VGSDSWIFDLHKKRTLWRSFSAYTHQHIIVLPIFQTLRGDPDPALQKNEERDVEI